MSVIPAGFARTLRDLHGEAGARWLEVLPDLLADLGRRWSLELGRPFPDPSYSYVLPARLVDGSEAVLKLRFPVPGLHREVEALRLYDGRGSVRLLAADVERGAMLLERVRPGSLLVEEASDEKPVVVAAGVMERLWRPLKADHPFRPVSRWAEGLGRLRARFHGGTGPLPARLVEAAEARFDGLLASSGPAVLLHGDLHHFNILASSREGWLALDPKGVVGEAAYDVGALLRNPMPQVAGIPDLESLTRRRVALLAERLGFDRERITAWAAAQAVLSVWWTIEDHGRGWEPWLRVAEALLRVHETRRQVVGSSASRARALAGFDGLPEPRA